MSLPRHTLIEELHKFARLVRGGEFDPDSDGVAEVLSGAAAMLTTDSRERAVTVSSQEYNTQGE